MGIVTLVIVGVVFAAAAFTIWSMRTTRKLAKAFNAQLEAAVRNAGHGRIQVHPRVQVSVSRYLDPQQVVKTVRNHVSYVAGNTIVAAYDKDATGTELERGCWVIRYDPKAAV